MRLYLIAIIGGFVGGVIYSAIKDLLRWRRKHNGKESN